MRMMRELSKVAIVLFAVTSFADAFVIISPQVQRANIQPITKIPKTVRLFAANTDSIVRSTPTRAKPRTGLAQKLLDVALSSPFWKLVLVPQARKNIVQTAEANGIQWKNAYEWLESQKGPWQTEKKLNYDFPDYYRKEFHAYADGNLCWNAAIEQELASRAVGARNFPAHGADGEDAFRSAFESAIIQQGGTCPDGGIIVDLGCGTGTSTRRLANLFPNALKLVGMDLSPYFVQVGQSLLELAPKKEIEWVSTITPDDRIELCIGDATNTNLDDQSVDVVNLSLVIHEFPVEITVEVCKEALRVLKPGGQIFVSEMDFDSPAYAAQRENALLFSLLRSTEPYLDDYAEGCEEIRNFLVANFDTVKITAATGRHYAMVATKKVDPFSDVTGVLQDSRFNDEGDYIVNDTHLKVWESKE